MEKIANSVRMRVNSEGCYTTAIPDLSLYRYTQRSIQMPEPGAPYLYLLAAGSIRLHTPSGMMDYVAGQYFISAIDTPSSGYALAFSENTDFLALSIRFTLNDVISVVLDMDGDLAEKIVRGDMAEGVDRAGRSLLDAAARHLCFFRGRQHTVCRIICLAKSYLFTPFLSFDRHLSRLFLSKWDDPASLCRTVVATKEI